jgi:hypothetical protein
MFAALCKLGLESMHHKRRPLAQEAELKGKLDKPPPPRPPPPPPNNACAVRFAGLAD